METVTTFKLSFGIKVSIKMSHKVVLKFEQIAEDTRCSKMYGKFKLTSKCIFTHNLPVNLGLLQLRLIDLQYTGTKLYTVLAPAGRFAPPPDAINLELLELLPVPSPFYMSKKVSTNTIIELNVCFSGRKLSKLT